jgi:Cd2+/Zn2+-exporting ATPase/Cu+-exporting ATPase
MPTATTQPDPPTIPGTGPPEPVERPEVPGSDARPALSKTDGARIVFVGICALAVWVRVWEPLPRVSVIGWAGVLIGGWPIFREAAANLRARRMTMELSMTIALAAAMFIHEVVPALMIAFFVLIAEALERLTVGRGRNAIKDLVQMLPHRATVRRGPAGEPAEVDAAELRPGDLVIVKPGERVPVDGEVMAGHTYVNQAAITGESMPVAKTVGDRVFAGTVNDAGSVEVRAEGIGRDTAFGRIVEAVERAEHVRAPIQRIADRLAAYLVYLAAAGAVLTFAITWNIRSAIAVVMVAGACGIAAGTPLAILGAIGRSARHGSIIKGGIYLEVLGRVDTVVLDKTGTLTFGVPAVTAVRPCAGISAEQLIAAAAAAEARSEHPLGRAVIGKAGELAIPVAEPQSFEYTPGKGVICRAGGAEIIAGNKRMITERGIDVVPDGSTAAISKAGVNAEATSPAPAASPGSIIYVARDGRLQGRLEISDGLRPEAIEAVASLRRMGVRTVLLTGDAWPIARSVAGQVGADDVRAEVLPSEKAEHVRALLSAGRTVAMVGDGINDAPALTAASVGVAMGSGTEVARESADIVLIGNDLSKLVETIATARWCRRVILQNFWGTVTVDAAGVVLAALGRLSPLGAALIHVGSELVFLLNSARLLPGRVMAAAGGRSDARPPGGNGTGPRQRSSSPVEMAGRRAGLAAATKAGIEPIAASA